MAKAEGKTTRSYHSPLRKAQAEATRNLILETLAEMVATDGLVDLSIRDLANRAEMSERTVYRHFPDRDSLFEALIDKTATELDWDSAEDRLGIGSYADIVDAIPAVFESFEREETATRVAVQLANVLGRVSDDGKRRNDRHRVLLERHLPDLDPDSRERLFALLRVVMSSRTWLRLEDEFGYDASVSGPMVAWVIRLMLDDVARTGIVPGGPESAES